MESDMRESVVWDRYHQGGREASLDHQGELEDRSVQAEELRRQEEKRCIFPGR
jgi:hypothetical protein